MMLVTPRLLVAVTVLLAVTVMVSGLQPTEEKEEIILHPYQGGEDIEQNTWTFLSSRPGKYNNVTRDLIPYEWLLFNQTDSLLKRWRLVTMTRRVPNTTLEEAHGRVEPTYPVPPMMELSTWNFDEYNTTTYKQSEQSTWKFLYKKLRNFNNASYDVKHPDWLLFKQTDPLLKRWRLVITTRPVMMNIQSVGVHQNLSDPDITPGEVHESVEPSANVPSMKEPSIENFDDYAIGTQSELQNTWTFLRCFPGISDNLSRDLMPYEWLIFNQTHPLLKRWRLVLTTRSVPETTLGEDDGRVEPTDPVPPTMEPLTWYFDYYYATRYAQSVSATWKFIGKKIRNSKNASYDVKLRDYLIFNQTDPLLKRWRLVITTRPVMMNIQSAGVHQNLSEPDITPGEVHGSVEPTDNVPSMKEPSTGNFDDNAIPGTQSETPEIENTMEHNHQENEQQIAKTGNAANSAYQMKIEENKSKIKLVRPYPLERDFM